MDLSFALIFFIGFECMPQRVFVCLMAFLGLTICQMMRFAMSLCLTVIAIKKKSKTESECGNYGKDTGGGYSDPVFDWDEKIQAKILAGFFWGYIITQFPAGIMAELWGPRRVVFCSGLITSVVTLAVGPITYLLDWPGLLVLRILTGLAQGAFYAAMHAVVALWVPKSERGLLGSLVFVGVHMGNIGSVAITGLILEAMGPTNWYWLFLIYGSIGLLWSLLFCFMTYENYQECPEGLLKENEKNKLDLYYADAQKTNVLVSFTTNVLKALTDAWQVYIKETGFLWRRKNKVKFLEVPWSKIATNLPVYALAVAIWGHCWGLFILINNIPKYMASVLGFKVSKNGLYLGGAYALILVATFASGYVVDWLARNNKMSISWNRILFTTIASVLPSLGLLGVSYCDCSGICAFAFLILGMGAMGAFYPSLKINAIDLTPTYGSTVGSLTHWLGTTAGALGPPVVAMMAPDSTISQYREVMWLTFGLMTVTNIFYIFFGSGNKQKFNDHKAESNVENKT